MSRILICAIVISAAAIPIYASDLRVIQRDVFEIANGYQVTVGVDFAGSPEAVSAWQLACQITPGDLTISVSPPDNYLFSDSESSALGCSWDEQTQSTLFYDYGWPPPSPLSGSNLVRIDLTSNSAEPFDFDFVFLPYNGETQSGSYWLTADDPSTFRHFDLSSVPEPPSGGLLLFLSLILFWRKDRRRY